mgnify:CR=1 FL=1
MKVSTILDSIDEGTITLPEFQRGYVWNRKQVKEMMDSLYRSYPVGSFLIWVTKSEKADVRGDEPRTADVKLLLDGQQRVTSLYGIIRGAEPPFFDGNAKAFTGLYFNIEEEIFEFYMKQKMKDNPLWIDVTKLMQEGVARSILRMKEIPDLSTEDEMRYINRLNCITNIRERDFHVDEVTGKDKNTDVVVEIFNKVNSGGTKLSKGDLAMAKIAAMWPDARDEMKSYLAGWEDAGYRFSLDWLLRCVNAVLTGKALFTALEDVSRKDFETGLYRTKKYVDKILNIISSRLGLDHNGVFKSKFSIALLARYFHEQDGHVTSPEEIGKLLFWYIHTVLWGRYAGSTESHLRQDLVALQDSGDSLGNVIDLLKLQRGTLEVIPDNYRTWSRGARFYPMLYMLSRVNHAKDWMTEVELQSSLLGTHAKLHLHHIFPKSKLYDHEYDKIQVNSLANFTFLTAETNQIVSNRDPEEYMPEIEANHPGMLRTHWIPMDPELWKYDNYLEFLERRRELLARATNEFIDSLLTESVPYSEEEAGITAFGGIASDDEEMRILEACEWIENQGLSEGQFEYELVDDNTGNLIAILDLAWPEGLQEGLTEPVALLVDEPRETEEAAGRFGFRYFTSVMDLKDYVKKELLNSE